MNKKFFIVLLIAYSLAYTSCSVNNKNINYEDLPVITGSIIKYSQNAGDIGIVYSNDNVMYISHYKSSPLLSKFEISKENLIHKGDYIYVGKGPKEIQSLTLNSVSSDNTKIIFNDPNLRKTITFICDNDSIVESVEYMGMRSHSGIDILRLAVGHPQGTLVTYVCPNKTEDEGFVGFISKSDSTLHPILNIGKNEIQNLTVPNKMYCATNSQVFVQPNGNKCLFVSNIGQFAEIFEIKDYRATNKAILVDNVPNYSLNDYGRIAWADDDLKYGFRVSVTSDRIYLAPYRMTYSERKDGLKSNPKYSAVAQGPEFVDEIWEFDWNGKLLRKLRLNSGISSFKVSPSHILWSVSEDENFEPTIVKYKLN